MKRESTIKKELERAGFTVIERDGCLVLAQELQRETRTFMDESDGYSFEYAPMVYEGNWDTSIAEEVAKITGKDWFWECEYPTCFKLYRA